MVSNRNSNKQSSSSPSNDSPLVEVPSVTEKPVVSVLLDTFVSNRYRNTIDDDSKDLHEEVKDLCDRLIRELNQKGPPKPSGNDSEAYKSAYSKWKKDRCNVAHFFGRSLLLKQMQYLTDTLTTCHYKNIVVKEFMFELHEELQGNGNSMDDSVAAEKGVTKSSKKRSRSSDDSNIEDISIPKKKQKLESSVKESLEEEKSKAQNRIIMTTVIYEQEKVKKENTSSEAVSALTAPANNQSDLDHILGPETLYASMSRDEIAKREEDHGSLSFEVVKNDSDIRSLEKLLALKNIFGRQLPKMPKEYITRLVFDRNHRSMVGFKGNRVVGGITFRPFFEQGFGEIAFCAITGNEQVKGYGTRLMNHLKDYCQQVRVFRFLTYADNYAIGYFKKQGFTKEITLDEKRYRGFIKDYDGGTLMECVLRPKVPYLDVPGMLKTQRAAVYEKMKEISNSHIVYPGIDVFKRGSKLTKIEEVPGLKEAGFKDSDFGDANGSLIERTRKLRDQLRKVLRQIQDHEYSWPFLQPVDAEAVPDYYDVIKEPIDLQTIENRLEDNYYRTMDIFVMNFRLLFDNCRQYNSKDSVYYECAEKLEAFFKKIMRNVVQQT